jgi:Phenazine biosynthesis-like protein
MSRATTEILRYAAFTKDGIGGNPAGVILDAYGLSDEEMLKIAAEVVTRKRHSSPSVAAPGRSLCATSVLSPRLHSAVMRR